MFLIFFNGLSLQSTDFFPCDSLPTSMTSRFIIHPSCLLRWALFSPCLSHSPSKFTSYTWSQFRSALLPGEQILKSLFFSLPHSFSPSLPSPSLLPLPNLSAFSFIISKTSSPWSWPGHLLHYMNWFHCIHRSLNRVMDHFNSPTPTIPAAMSLKSVLTFHSYWFFCPICSSFLLISFALTHIHSCF